MVRLDADHMLTESAFSSDHVDADRRAAGRIAAPGTVQQVSTSINLNQQALSESPTHALNTGLNRRPQVVLFYIRAFP